MKIAEFILSQVLLRFLKIHVISSVLLLVMVAYTSPVYGCNGSNCLDGECSDGRDPVERRDCIFGLCGICEVDNGWDGWAHPKAEVIYMPMTYSWTGPGSLKYSPHRATIEIGRCKRLAGVRFCVRPTKAGERGNHTRHPQICAYEDPDDFMDPPDGNMAHDDIGPFHEHTSNADALSISKSAIYGAMALGIGSVFGATAAATTQYYNYVVMTNIGCVDRKIGPPPPTWSNNAWFYNSLPMPTFVEATGAEKAAADPDSVFESPRIKAKVCGYTSGIANNNEIISCGVAGSVEYPAAGAMLNPKWDADPAKNYKDCKTLSDGRRYCAEINTAEPEKIKISSVDAGASTVVAMLDRPGYIPKPVITEATGSLFDRVKMKVALRGKEIVLEEPVLDAGGVVTNPDKQSAILHQVRFGIERPCVTPPAAGQTCSARENMVCATGYNTGPFVAILNSSLQPVQGTPNILKVKNIAFDNTVAKKEKGAFLSESYRKDLWIYSGSGVDLGTSSSPGTQNLRPVSASEAGLCVFTPPDMSETVYASTGTYTYTVPVNCSQLHVKVWGGGASGAYQVHGWGNAAEADTSGGAGGYVEDYIDVSAGQTFEVKIGEGGSVRIPSPSTDANGYDPNEPNRGLDGASSSVKKNVTGGTKWTAFGGQAKFQHWNEATSVGAGGSGEVSPPNATAIIIQGGSGQSSHGTSDRGTAGGAAHNLTAQAASDCSDWQHTGLKAPSAAGGCSRDDYGDASDGTEDSGSWGWGGDGRATLSCAAGLN